MKIRINKYLADSGIASRRGAEQFILDRKVKVNGRLVKELSTKVDPAIDKVTFKGKLVAPARETVVYMLNKPAGYTCTNRRFKGERSVIDLVKTAERIYPIGRLDKKSTGLILLTNDGDLANKLTHPRYEKEKEYQVTVDKDVNENFLNHLAAGVKLDDGKTLPAHIKYLTKKSFDITIRQGKNRQIRRMCAQLGYKVKKLHRTRLNSLELGSLNFGKWRELTDKERRLIS